MPPRSPTGRVRSRSPSQRFTNSQTRPPHTSWVTDFAAALDQGRTGAYVGFLGDEGEARVRDAYPESTWQRLAEIKRRYDPTSVAPQQEHPARRAGGELISPGYRACTSPPGASSAFGVALTSAETS
jgi:hypothetical protein